MLSDAPYEVPPYLLKQAGALPRCPMAVAGADKEVTLESARQAFEAGVITPVLIGDGDIIRSLCGVIGWDITGNGTDCRRPNINSHGRVVGRK